MAFLPVVTKTNGQAKTAGRGGAWAVLALAAALCAVLALAGCGAGASSEEGSAEEEDDDAVAATVNGEEIPESIITDYIAVYRENLGYADDDTWAQWLELKETTPEEVRENAIEYYVNYLLYTQKAEELGIEITDEDIDANIEAIKEANDMSQSDWEDFLESNGYDEESYRATTEYALLADELHAQEISVPHIDDDDLQTYLNENASSYEGKHMYAIAYDKEDYDELEELLDEIQEADDPGEAFMANVDKSADEDLAEDGGDFGWTSLDTHDSTSYELLIEDFKKGEVYPYVYEDDDYIYILYCADRYKVKTNDDEDETVDMSNIPDDLKEIMRSDAETQATDSLIETYKAKLRDEADVVIYDMPEDVPYNVEISESDDEEDDES